MSSMPITRVVLYKHGIGYFEREGKVENEARLALTFKQAEVSDVLKSLTVLDLDGGHIASVSYDSTKPLEQLLAEVALNIPDEGSLVQLLAQIKGARVALHSGVSDPIEGIILGIDTTDRQTGDGIVKVVLLSLLTDLGSVRSFDLHSQMSLQILDPILKRDLEYYLKTQLSAKKKDSRTFTFFAEGAGQRTIRISYTLGAPVWKATYRILLGEEAKPAMIQGWAVVDNTQDEDWENVQLSLISGLPVSFVHDLYTPRYIRRPEVRVQDTTGVLPPEVEEGVMHAAFLEDADEVGDEILSGAMPRPVTLSAMSGVVRKLEALAPRSAISSAPAQVRERKVGDLFEYEIEHPVTIRRNQSALVPIVLRGFEGRPVLLYNKHNRAENPMRSVDFKNTTGLTLEGGPVTVLEAGSYVGEAMLDTLKPDEERLVPYSVELSVTALDSIDSHNDKIHRVIIERGILKTEYVKNQVTTYQFKNKSDQEHVLYLDHPRGGSEWKLFATAEPRETTENYWRFRFTIAPKAVTPFVIRQKQTLHQAYALADIQEKQLGLWLEQKYVDAKTEKTLRQALDLHREAAALDAAVRTLDHERASINNEQKRIRENLASLGDRPAEKDLRERFAKTLNAQEDRLEQINREIQQKLKARDDCREKIAGVLGKLEYEAAV
ncbi:MAG: hypothetical protein HY040_25335 [Planctomycetes bacterium]|nr:hypothetical protein [Planctomycetota bacterium]